MRAIACAAILASALAGCTLIGGIGGATIASHNNEERAERLANGEQVTGSDSSVGGTALIGAGLGFVLDVVIASVVVHDLRDTKLLPTE